MRYLFFLSAVLLAVPAIGPATAADVVRKPETCTYMSQLWQWAEHREQRIKANAQCGGKYFQKAGDRAGQLANDSNFLADLQFVAKQNMHINLSAGTCSANNISAPGAEAAASPPTVIEDKWKFNASQSSGPSANFGAKYGEIGRMPAAVQANQVLQPITVQVSGNEAKYLSGTEPMSTSIAQSETADKLRMACAQAVIAAKKKTDPGFAAEHSVFDVRDQITLQEQAEEGDATAKHSALGFSYVNDDLSPEQNIAIVKRLNDANSCSTFKVEEGGVIQRSNCDQEMDKKIKNFRSHRLADLALAVFFGGICNFHRGGEIVRMPSDQITRADNAVCLAAIRPTVDHLPIDMRQFAWDFLRAYAAQMLLSAKGYVAGGRNNHSVFSTAMSGGEQNALYFSLVCGDARCGLAGLPIGAMYDAVGALANKKYQVFGRSANATSEFATGSVLGLMLGLKYGQEAKDKMMGSDNLTIEMARLSTEDYCVDVSDIVK